MAITLSQQQDLLTGKLDLPAITIIELISLAVQNYAITFSTTYQLFNHTDRPLAGTYLNKMLRTCLLIGSSDSRAQAIDSLKNIIISIISTAPDQQFSELLLLDDVSWSDIITNIVDDAFEIFSGVRIEEKSEYKNS